MMTAFGIIVVVLSLIAWGGQTITWLRPRTAERLTLVEKEDEVEPTYWADIRGEAAWDFLTLWTLVVAGVLLIMNTAAWPYFGLVGGGMYVYFAGRGIFTRTSMQRRKLRVGSDQSVRIGLAALTVWGVMGAATVIVAVVSLSGS